MITVYSIPTCPHCQALKKWLKENKIEFNDINVRDDKKAAEKMIKLTNQMSVPVIVIGKEYIVGFDKEKLKEKLL